MWYIVYYIHIYIYHIYIYIYVCVYICVYIYYTYIHIIYGIHHWRIFRSSYRKLVWVGFEPTTTEFRSGALTDWAIRPWVQLTVLVSIYLYFIIILDNQWNEMNKNNIFLRFDMLSLTKTFFLLPTPSFFSCIQKEREKEKENHEK